MAFLYHSVIAGGGMADFIMHVSSTTVSLEDFFVSRVKSSFALGKDKGTFSALRL